MSSVFRSNRPNIYERIWRGVYGGGFPKKAYAIEAESRTREITSTSVPSYLCEKLPIRGRRLVYAAEDTGPRRHKDYAEIYSDDERGRSYAAYEIQSGKKIYETKITIASASSEVGAIFFVPKRGQLRGLCVLHFRKSKKKCAKSIWETPYSLESIFTPDCFFGGWREYYIIRGIFAVTGTHRIDEAITQ